MARSRWYRRAALWWLLALAVGCGPNRPRPSATATPRSDVRRLRLYAALTTAEGFDLADAYGRSSGVPVEVVTAAARTLMRRIEDERLGGGLEADVMLLSDPIAMSTLAQQGAESAAAPIGQLPPALTGDGWAAAFALHNVLVAQEGGPTIADWSDLLRPELRNGVLLTDPAESGSALGVVSWLGEALGWDFLKRLHANGARTVASSSIVGTNVAQGTASAGITVDSVVRQTIAQGAPVVLVWPRSGAVQVPAPVGVLRGHESPATTDFVSWLLGDQGQSEIAKLGYVSVRDPSLGSEAAPAVTLDWTRLAQERESVIGRFKDAFS